MNMGINMGMDVGKGSPTDPGLGKGIDLRMHIGLRSPADSDMDIGIHTGLDSGTLIHSGRAFCYMRAVPHKPLGGP